MFSLQIVDTDAFLDMPQSSQLLYFHLSMRADDEGFVSSPKKIMKIIGSSEDDYKVLSAKKFIIPFESGVCVIKHWLIHNIIRMDRFHKTTYQKEKALLSQKDNGAYTLATNWQPTGNQMEPEVKLSKVKLSKDNINTSEQSSQVQEVMGIFYKINPTLNWGNKTSRKSAEYLISKFGFEGTKKMAEQIVSIQGQPFAPTATTPTQMKDRLAQFKIYFDREKNKTISKQPKVAIIPNN